MLAERDVMRFFLAHLDGPAEGERVLPLLRAAEQWLAARGMSRITGNFNLTAMQQIGVMTDGFDNAPFTDMMWSPPHIARHLERAGYTATFPMTTFEIALDGVQSSTRYPGGIALRFARVRRYRNDKDALQADVIGDLRALLPARG